MGVRYASGRQPCISLGFYTFACGVNIDSHRSQVDTNLVQLDPWTHQPSWQTAGHLDGADSPSCSLASRTAFDDGIAVAVFEAAGQNNLLCQAGRIVESPPYTYNIDWCGSAAAYDTGVTPSVSVNFGRYVVEVHKSKNYDNLYYRVGSLNQADYTVAWGDSHKYETGVDPSVSMTTQGNLVAVHKSEKTSNLYYNSGIIEPASKTINWLAKGRYDTGKTPSVSLNDHGLVVEVHQSRQNNNLYYHTGTYDFNSGEIEWGSSIEYDSGLTPSVSLDKYGNLLEVHKSQNSHNLFYNFGAAGGNPPEVLWLI
jgi:hypothetical protein